jgi:hypothetical protein
VLKALETILQPLARLFVEHGISSPEAERLLRAVCVHEVARTDNTHGKKPNASRVALVTGLDRGEVTRILNGSPKTEAIETRRHRVNKVLTGWHSDSNFSSNGRPLRLSIKAKGEGRNSFWALATRHAPGVYPGLMLSELLRVGAVEKLEDGRLRVLTRRYQAAEFSEENVSEIRTRVRDLIQTILNNPTEAGWPRICRTVESTDIDPRFLPLIRKLFADRSESLLSGVRAELNSSRWNKTDPVTQGVRIGMTVFTHEEWPQEDRSNEKLIDTPSEDSRRARRRKKDNRTK